VNRECSGSSCTGATRNVFGPRQRGPEPIAGGPRCGDQGGIGEQDLRHLASRSRSRNRIWSSLSCSSQAKLRVCWLTQSDLR
jgi:hypothetical protein